MEKLQEYFEAYVNDCHDGANDLTFWTGYLKKSLDERRKSQLPNEMQTSIFAIHDMNIIDGGGWLYFRPKVTSIRNESLDSFLDWLRNYSIVKFYNASEIFIYQVIQLKYFKNEDANLLTRAGQNKISHLIVSELKIAGLNTDTTNNRHLLTFLKCKSSLCNSFLMHQVNIDLNINWESFFDFISIIRNAVAHNSATLNPDALNAIKSKGKQLFERHFSQEKDNDDMLKLKPYGDSFLNLLNTLFRFTLNLNKYIIEGKDLSVFNMKKAGT